MRGFRPQSLWVPRVLCAALAWLCLAGNIGGYAGEPALQAPAKYVFLFIGDGMSSTQRAAADAYKSAMISEKTGKPSDARMLMNSLPVQGMNTTYAADSMITDSAAAGTAIATGCKTAAGVIGMDTSRTQKLTNIGEIAKQAGLKVGIVTSASLDHATPACFYAHTAGRVSYYKIAEQMVCSDFDYFAGGQLKGYNPVKHKDKPNLYELARTNGFSVVFGKSGLTALKPGTRAIAFTDNPDPDAALQYSIDRSSSDASLADFTRKGIELLRDNPAGFFMMVEGGKIDWACHANDARTAIADNLALDDAVAVAHEFMQQHPQETLLVVTGDHETGGMTANFAGTRYNTFPEELADQKLSFRAFSNRVQRWREKKTTFAEAFPQIKDAFGFTDLTPDERARLEQAYARSMQSEQERAIDKKTQVIYGSYEPLSVICTHILNSQAGLGWTSYAHTGVPVVTSAEGVGAERFNGLYDNIDIFQKILAAMKLKK